MGQNARKIGGAITAVFVCTQVQAHNARVWARRQSCANRLHPLVVKSKPIDRGLILRQSKQPRLWVAGLGARCGGTHFDKSKTCFGQGRDHFGVFIIPCGQSDGVW